MIIWPVRLLVLCKGVCLLKDVFVGAAIVNDVCELGYTELLGFGRDWRFLSPI